MNLAKLALAGLAVALVVAAAALAGVGRSTASSADPLDHSITVSGSGSVAVVPDRAHMTFGVETRGATATEALAANAVAMRKVIAAIRGSGIPAADIRTQQVSVSPTYSDDGDSITGYLATNAGSVTVRKLADAGVLIDRAVAAGANQVDGPALDAGDTAALYHKALEAAIADARAKAETIAASSALTLGRATNVTESTSEPPVRDEMKSAPVAGSSTPIESGTQELEATVTVTYSAA